MSSTDTRIDTASRLVRATPAAIYLALTDPEAIVCWRPPGDMTAEVHDFDARVGGRFRMTFRYAAHDAQSGKTAADADMFEGRFVELVPGRRVVEEVAFVSEDPAFAGTMVITTSLAAQAGGILVTIACSSVPAGISATDHQIGLASTLAKLAAYVEAPDR